MNPKNALVQLIIDLVTEFVTRLKAKSPKLFVWIQKLSVVVVALTGLPDAINWLLGLLPENIAFQLPEWVGFFSNKIAAYAGIIAWVIAKLPIAAKADVADKDTPISTPTK